MIGGMFTGIDRDANRLIDFWKNAILRNGDLIPGDIEGAKMALPHLERLTDLCRALAAWNPDHLKLDDAGRAMLLALLEPDTDEAAGE